MTTSARYRELQRAVRKIRNALLPDKFDPTGTYRSAQRVHLRTVSFRILVHAEIEAFIEERAHDLFDQALRAWRKHRISSRVIASMIAFSGHSMPTPPSRLGSPGKKNHEDIEGILDRAKKQWKSESYKKNHGIKESNVLSLLLPLGIRGSELDPTLLADLTSFGGARGAVAHSSSIGVTNFADPKSEYEKAQQLIESLASIDELIEGALDELSKVRRSFAGGA